MSSNSDVKDSEYFCQIIENIADWLTSTKYNKNLNICGSVGIGKSTILRAIMDLMNGTSVAYHKTLITANSVADIAINSDSSWERIITIPILLVDDVGTEPYEVREYGNSYLPFTQLVEERYNRNLTTIITTNLSMDDINNRYGLRIADRIGEYHTIKYNRRSYRYG